MEREREGGEAGSISVNSSLNCHRLSIPYRGRFSFLASVAKCLDTRFEIEACFLFFFFDRGWKMVEPEKSRNFLILLPRFFFGGRRFLYFCIVEIVSIFSFFFFFEGVEEDSCCISMLF